MGKRRGKKPRVDPDAPLTFNDPNIQRAYEETRSVLDAHRWGKAWHEKPPKVAR